MTSRHSTARFANNTKTSLPASAQNSTLHANKVMPQPPPQLPVPTLLSVPLPSASQHPLAPHQTLAPVSSWVLAHSRTLVTRTIPAIETGIETEIEIAKGIGSGNVIRNGRGS